MRPPAIVSNPYPSQEKPWVHRCHKHGCRMVPNAESGGIHCPVCAGGEPKVWTPAPALDGMR